MDNFKEDVIKANEDEFVVEWISHEEEQKQYEEVLYEKGLSQGKQQGLSEGIEKGLMKKSNEIAKKMLELNMDLETISKVTGLTIDEIKNFKS